ncbi:MAG: LysR substrate-binding domain-containing protein, partial [Myxococcota bacterium]
HRLRLLQHQAAMWRAWQSGIHAVRSSGEHPRGTLRITTPGYLFHSIVDSAMAKYLERYPEVSVTVDVSDERRTLGDGTFDLALRVAEAVDEENVHHQKLASDEDIVVASPEVASRFTNAQRPEHLLQARWVLHQGLPAERVFDHPNEEPQTLSLQAAVLASTGHAMRSLTLCGAGVSILPRLLARDDLAAGRLLHLVPDWNCGRINIYAVQPRASTLSPKVARFLEILRTAVIDVVP